MKLLLDYDRVCDAYVTPVLVDSPSLGAITEFGGIFSIDVVGHRVVTPPGPFSRTNVEYIIHCTFKGEYGETRWFVAARFSDFWAIDQQIIKAIGERELNCKKPKLPPLHPVYTFLDKHLEPNFIKKRTQLLINYIQMICTVPFSIKSVFINGFMKAYFGIPTAIPIVPSAPEE